MKDILWWITFVETWNRKSVFYEDGWTTSDVLSFATDASNLGMGGVLHDSWWATPFNPAHLKHPIAWRDLLAIVVSCRLWGHKFTTKGVLIQCDNLAMVHSVNKVTSKNPAIISLVRDLYFVCSQFCFDIRLTHLAGVLNIGPDLLSRLDFQKLHQLFPHAGARPTVVPQAYLLF
jgi:hypothetical protein